MLQNQYLFSANSVTITQVVANLGALTGGVTVGYLSQMFGRRLSIIVMCFIGGALLYPYSFIGNERVIAAAFFEQFCVQGAWGGESSLTKRPWTLLTPSSDPDPPHGVVSWQLPNIRGRNVVPAREPGLFCQLDN